MKKNLLILNKEKKVVYHPDAIVFFSENKIKNGATKDGKSFMIMPTESIYNDFVNKFNIPDNLTIVIKKYSAGELFAYYDKMCEENETLLGAITSTHGILGDGVYSITENDFLNSNSTEEMINKFNLQRIGYETNKEVIIIFEYYGYYYKIVSNQNNSLCKLITTNIPLEAIKSILELTVSIS